jgi:hypothetical protein
LQLQNRDQVILDLHHDLKGQAWPVVRVPQSTQGPIEKWLRTLRKKSEWYRGYAYAGFHTKGRKQTDNDGNKLDFNGNKWLQFNFSTTHNGAKVQTHVHIMKNANNEDERFIGIHVSGGRSYGRAYYSDAIFTDMPAKYNRKPDKQVFGLDWFQEPEVADACNELFKKVDNQ